jgi:hypothetical protein
MTESFLANVRLADDTPTRQRFWDSECSRMYARSYQQYAVRFRTTFWGYFLAQIWTKGEAKACNPWLSKPAVALARNGVSADGCHSGLRRNVQFANSPRLLKLRVLHLGLRHVGISASASFQNASKLLVPPLAFLLEQKDHENATGLPRPSLAESLDGILLPGVAISRLFLFRGGRGLPFDDSRPRFLSTTVQPLMSVM